MIKVNCELMNKSLLYIVFTIFCVFISNKMFAKHIREGIDDNTIFSVYELSSKTTAIVSNMNESEGEASPFDEVFLLMDEQERFIEGYYDSIYDNKTPASITYRDTTGIFRIVYNKKVAEQIKPLLAKEFFVYGTKGMQNHTIEDVVFSLDECRTNFFAFTFDNFDNNKNGHPVIASEKKIDLIYGNDYADIEKKINEYYSGLESDYKDNIPVKVYAHTGNLYFSYNDDFKWNKKNKTEDPECLFPDRAIFALNEDGTVELFWYDGLDLYGIPCD